MGGLLLFGASTATPAPAFYTFPGIIKLVAVTGTSVCEGEPAAVLVQATHPTVPGGAVDVFVDGFPGSPQIVQYAGPSSPRMIRITAVTQREGLRDAQEVPLEVVPCPGSPGSLRLLATRNPFNRYRVDLRAQLSGRLRPRVFHWWFGDGQTAVTTEPFVSHDYAPNIQHGEPYSYFLPFVVESGSNLWSGRRIALASSFVLSRRMGFIQADVDLNLTKTATGLVVGVQVFNRHTEAIRFDRYVKQYLPCDPNQPPRLEPVVAERVFGSGAGIVHPPGDPSPGMVTVSPKKKKKSRLVLSLESVPPETCAIGFNLLGSSGRDPVYASYYFPVRRNPLFTGAVTDAQTRSALESLLDANLVPSDEVVSAAELHLLEQRGLIARTPQGWRR